MAVKDQAVIPVVYRPDVAGHSNQLQCIISGWDNNTWDLSDWYKEA